MELISWMWVFDKRFFFEVNHSRDRILIAWSLPCLFTAAAISYILADKNGEAGLLWIAVALGILKIACMSILSWR